MNPRSTSKRNIPVHYHIVPLRTTKDYRIRAEHIAGRNYFHVRFTDPFPSIAILRQAWRDFIHIALFSGEPEVCIKFPLCKSENKYRIARILGFEPSHVYNDNVCMVACVEALETRAIRFAKLSGRRKGFKLV